MRRLSERDCETALWTTPQRLDMSCLDGSDMISPHDSPVTSAGGWDGESLVGAFAFRPLTQQDAERIARWRYTEPYSFYDWESDPDDLAEFLDATARGGDYVAVEGDDGTVIGFLHYKRPHGATLEIGLGLRPDVTGRGLGRSFVEAGLEYARRRFAPVEFGLSVATFNRRAITVYERAGFAATRMFPHGTNGGEWEFVEMRRPA
jgi:ribosomal-protein-alanine N-acetyltransferase